jgi:hypothetical protein
VTRVDKVVVGGVFSLDGQDFDVDNNVWLVGDDDEVLYLRPHAENVGKASIAYGRAEGSVSRR